MSDYTAEPTSRSQAADTTAPAAGSGCMHGGVLAALDIWIFLAVLAYQGFTWIIEQELATAHAMPDPRWIAVAALGLAVLVPSALAWLNVKTLPACRFFRAYALAGLLVLLLAPARLAGLTGAYRAAGLLVLGMLVFLALTALLRRRGARARAGWGGSGAALLLGAILGLPWLLLGAFGSLADVLLNLAVALLFGLCAARVVAVTLDDAGPRAALLLEGKVIGFALLVMGSALGVNGNQALVAFGLSALGWALAALYRRSDGAQPADNRRALALLAALAVFWPLALLDPDELAAAPVFGLFELLGWTFQALFWNILTALAAGALLGALRARLASPRLGWAAGLAALGIWVGAAALYLTTGQPGLHGDRLFVIFTEQADLSQAAAVEDYAARRQAVYAALVEQADRSQSGVRQSLDGWGVPYRPFYLENAVEVQGGPLLRWWLERRPEVDRVLESPVLRPLAGQPAEDTGFDSPPDGVPWNLTLIGADRVWEELGVTGAGIVVGQSDSGVQGDHTELADSYRGRADGADYNWYDPWNGTGAPVDIGGHGTHTLGTVLGNQVGVAPDAEWIGCVNLARNLGSPSYYLECMEFSFAPFPQGGDPLRDGRPELGAHVLNNSWGCPPLEGCDAAALVHAVTALRAAGVFVVVSAGNDGPECGTVADPISLFDEVYSVGAVDSSRVLAPFSSTGPVTVDGSRRVKPDIAAPGVRVLSAYPGSTYSTASGTSMAGPHVAGVVALMWSANPDLIGDIDRTEEILNATAGPYDGPLPPCAAPGTPNNAIGYGILDAYEAVSTAMGQ